MTTIIAFLFYAASLTIVWLFAADLAVVSGTVTFLYALLFGAPFFWLLVRLYTQRDEPWPYLSLPAVAFGLCLAFMTLIAWPGIFAGLPLKSAVGAQRSNLYGARERLSRYSMYSSTAPAALSEVMPEMPLLKLPLTPHVAGNEVRVASFTDIQDSGKWLYVAGSTAPVLLIDCTHVVLGRPWSSL
ncbi:MAG TPA: hypothetical protein PKI19_04585 [Elusimicrobiales bacterium]|nr:hypothetical protein [Elusimicrobiales bacterium]